MLHRLAILKLKGVILHDRDKVRPKSLWGSLIVFADVKVTLFDNVPSIVFIVACSKHL